MYQRVGFGRSVGQPTHLVVGQVPCRVQPRHGLDEGRLERRRRKTKSVRRAPLVDFPKATGSHVGRGHSGDLPAGTIPHRLPMSITPANDDASGKPAEEQAWRPRTCLPDWGDAELPLPRPLGLKNPAGFIGPGIVMCGIQLAGGPRVMNEETVFERPSNSFLVSIRKVAPLDKILTPGSGSFSGEIRPLGVDSLSDAFEDSSQPFFGAGEFCPRSVLDCFELFLSLVTRFPFKKLVLKVYERHPRR